ncbi:MAG: S49 family peptidase, partial [Pseudomonadota bacterium]
RSGMTFKSTSRLLRAAFGMKRAPAVALLINSPGGSPVQSALITSRIRELAAEKEKPVIAFVEDVAASGGYWLACAGDEIYADRSSIIGNIGVIAAGFGFTDAIQRLGIQRRVYTTGPHKGLLDPFRPENEGDIAILKDIQGEIYEAFKEHVRNRRGDKLKLEDGKLFDGRVWGGKGAVEGGLIDGLGHPIAVLKERFGKDVRIRLLEPRGSWLARRFGGSEQRSWAADIAEETLASLEARMMWQRYGL